MRAFALCLLLGLAACGTSDADRIDTMIEAVTGELSQARVEQAVAKYVDPTQQALLVSAFGDVRIYDADDAALLKAEADRRLSFLYGKRLNIMRRHVRIQDSEARVELSLVGREGLVGAHYTLVKRPGDRWLISELSITR